MKRSRSLSIFIVGTGLLPVLLLCMAVRGTRIAARELQDVNLSGSLRFRSVWLYGATHTAPAEDWRPMCAKTEDIRRHLRVHYPAEVAQTDGEWASATQQLSRTGQIDWATANALRGAFNVLTDAIEEHSRTEAARASWMFMLGLVGLAALLTKSLHMARRTERAEAEQLHLSAILEATPDFVGMADPHGQITFLNTAFYQMAGLAPGAILRGLHIKECHPEWAALLMKNEAWPAVREHGFWTGESALLDANGGEVPVSQTVLAHRNASGDIERVSTIARDISAARRAEKASRLNEDRLRRLHDLTTRRDLSFAKKVDSLLHLGCAFFNVDIGVVSHVMGERHTITHAVSPENAIPAGLSCETASTYCTRVLDCKSVQHSPHVGSSHEWRDLPAYAVFGLETYLGAPLWVGERLHGTLCFAQKAPRSHDFSASDREVLQLMSQWLGGEMARAETEDALRHTEEKFRAIFENAMEGIVQTTPQGRFLTANPAIARLLGYDSPQQLIEEMTNISSQLYVNPAERARYRELLAQDGRAVAFEACLRRRDGTTMWASMNARAVRDGSGEVIYYEGSVEDVTERHEAAERLRDYSVVLEFQKAELEKANAELEMLATTDGLTGLKNHRAFQQRLAEACETSERYDTPLSLLILDVDHFKQYNDSFGHPEGDAVLRQVAQILTQTARGTDIAARYGGEEFAIILPHTDADGALVFGERVRAAIERATWPHRAIAVSAGVCTLLPGVSSPSEMVSAADAALYLSKQSGRNRVSVAGGQLSLVA